MKRLGDMVYREPNDEERQAMLDVVEIAEAWQEGRVGLSSVRTLCTGHDRYQAMRFAPLGSKEKRSVMVLVDALVEQDTLNIPTGHGVVNKSEVEQDGVKLVMTWKGQRAYVWPMCWMNGIPYYPRYDLPPGEDRRDKEEAIRLSYKQYRVETEARRKGHRSQRFGGRDD